MERWGGPAAYRRGGGKGGRGGGRDFFAPKRGSPPLPGGKGRYSFPHQPDYYGPSSSGPSSSGGGDPGKGGGGPWRRLLSHKAIVLEPRSSSDLKDAMSEFDRYISSSAKSSGCVLMGVCRGKISEGIDFSDARCRAVVITGIPFAPFLDPKVRLKREFLDRERLTRSERPSGEGGFGGGGRTRRRGGGARR